MSAYVLRICDWSSDVCSSDLSACRPTLPGHAQGRPRVGGGVVLHRLACRLARLPARHPRPVAARHPGAFGADGPQPLPPPGRAAAPLALTTSPGAAVEPAPYPDKRDRKRVVSGKSVHGGVCHGGVRTITKKQYKNKK